MKRFTRVLALMLVAAMLCVALVACGSKPNKDPYDARQSLKDAGYHIQFIDDEEQLVQFGDYDGLVAFLRAEKDDNDIDGLEEMNGETIYIEYVKTYYFESEKDAKKAFVELEDELNAWIKRMEDELSKSEEHVEQRYGIQVDFKMDPVEATLDGCMIYVGTSGALKDAK